MNKCPYYNEDCPKCNPKMENTKVSKCCKVSMRYIDELLCCAQCGKSTEPENTKANFLLVGKMSECGHCNPKFAAGLANVLKNIPDYKCECQCHTKEESWSEEFDRTFWFCDSIVFSNEHKKELVKDFIRKLLNSGRKMYEQGKKDEKARIREEVVKMKKVIHTREDSYTEAHKEGFNEALEDIKEILK